MKISWKLLCATLIVIISTFSIGGYILISSLFSSSLDREIETSKDDNLMFYMTLSTVLNSANINDKEDLSSVTQFVIQQLSDNYLEIRIFMDESVLYESIRQPSTLPRLENLTSDAQQYTVIQTEKSYFIQTGYLMTYSDSVLSIETFRNITSLFDRREEQFDLYRWLLLLLIVINVMMISLITVWITHPLTVLSRVVRRIAGGDLNKRVKIRSKDEVGKLAEDFNKMADNLEIKMSDLEDYAKRQQDFSASFAHEVKTPLTSIIGYADFMRSQQMSEEERMITADKIFREGKRLEALSFKLLDLIVLQKREFEMRKIEISQLVESVVTSFVLSGNKKICVNLKLQCAYLQLEPDLIRTLMINLIDNAVKSIHSEGIISITGNTKDIHYHLHITDNGKGIPKEDINRITEAFYMADKSRTRASGGVGLGLAICKEIIDLHNGEIKFESEIGRGTTVHVILKEAINIEQQN